MKEIKRQSESGQTLVETMVAVFIMVMGITAALGLALYSLNATSLVSKQVAAMGLAREGLEAVKNMRDTNWLKARTFDEGCNCYVDWREAYYTIQTTDRGAGGFALDFNPYQAPYWTLDPVPISYRLVYDAKGTNGRLYYPSSDREIDMETDKPQGGFGFMPESSRPTASDFYRRIFITEDTSSPYDSISPRLEITADVWWNDKKCNQASTFESASPACRVSLKTYLTNWKNY